MSLYGEYNEYGYAILDEKDGVLYSAGNHQCDSQQIAKLNSPEALPLGIMKKYCEQTGQEIALDRDTDWIGAQEIAT